VPVVPDYESSAKVRERAEKFRMIAGTYNDAGIRDQMLMIAAGYDRMADQMEDEAKASRSKQTFQRMAVLVQSIEKHHTRTMASCREMRELTSLSREVIANARELMASTAQRVHLDRP